MIWQQRASSRLLALILVPAICGFLLVQTDVMGSASADSKEIKKLVKEFKKAVRGEEHDNAIDIGRQIAAYGTEDAMEALYDLGYKEGRNPKVYASVCEELSRLDGIIEFISSGMTRSIARVISASGCTLRMFWPSRPTSAVRSTIRS